MRISLLSILLITFLLGGCASQPTMSQTPSPESSHSGSFGKSDY
jgi:PBP1b-binding outer membrane lipoprotein LpoB